MVAPRLPTSSPFFGSTSAAAAAKTLAGMFERPAAFAKDIQALATPAKRKDMAFAAAITSMGGKPLLAGVNATKVTNIGSIAKLALLYAAVQLRADVGIIGSTPGLADEESKGDRRRSFVDAVRAAFVQSNDPNLQRIGRDREILPRLARIFDVDQFLSAKSSTRAPRNLEFSGAMKPDAGDSLDSVPYASKPNPTADDLPFDSRLRLAMRAENEAAASCIADVGLPYIQALLTRTGFGQLHGTTPGLWLADFYGVPPQRGSGDYPAITSYGEGGVACGIKAPCAIGRGSTGQAGTAEGLATFLTLLQQDRLVSSDDSAAMRGYLVRGGRVSLGLSGIGDGQVLSKVGILAPWYSDAALVKATAVSTATQAADAGAASGRSVDWIAIALVAQGTESNATEVIKQLAKDMEQVVAKALGK